jgi:hypothetical protein
MSVRFYTEVHHDTGRPRLVVRSSHHIIDGINQNILNSPCSPTLDIADALELRGKLDNFIREATK